MALIWGNGGLSVTFYDRDPEKAHPCAERVFWHILRQNRSRGVGCSELQEPKKRKITSRVNTLGAQSRMRGNKTPGQIVMIFCTGVGVHDVITSANFYDCRLWGLSLVGSNFGFLH